MEWSQRLSILPRQIERCRSREGLFFKNFKKCVQVFVVTDYSQIMLYGFSATNGRRLQRTVIVFDCTYRKQRL
jgi:hypothetical protein